ncbi:ankyrin repeat-containing domain protein [Hypoxylon rubiginosum]|uniref:Ankyrin repeat-containing domain protein n=1 Tax=Hypoxylon rubiginosum TaxID=110542 RepID=A0ACC0CY50_9PEZI|nr:ankyrin repeat-containing domain protein [Hypoxylon rubiginosum]
MAADLGGVIVKRALLFAMKDTTYQLVYAKTFLLMFFGTPHQASQEWSWEATTLKIIEDAYRYLRGPWLLDRVHQLSYYLEKVRLDFSRILGKFRIVNYFQDLPESSSEVVTVDKSCAELHGFGITEIGVNVTHYELHCFVNESPGEDLIARRILDTQSYADEIYCQLVQWLSLEADGTETSFCVPGYDHLANRIVHTEKLEAIIRNDEAKIVLLGIEAEIEARKLLSGMRDAISRTMPQYPGVCIACSAITPNEPFSLTETGLLSSFLLQILKQHPFLMSDWLRTSLGRIIFSLRTSNVELKIRALRECLRLIFTYSPDCQGFWLIHTTGTVEQRRILHQVVDELQYFDRLAEVSWKVIIVSDSKRMVDFPSSKSLSKITLSHDILKESIDEEIESQLDLIIPKTSTISNIREKVLQVLLKPSLNLKLAGFFLQTLQPISPLIVDVLADLTNVFSCTKTAFQHIFEQVPKHCRAWVRKMLEFICFSIRPMTTTELEIAIATGNCHSLQQLEDKIGYGTAAHLVVLLPGVLRIQEGKIYIIHDELKPFLAQSPNDAWYHIGDCHLEIALTCYNYLSLILSKFGSAEPESLTAIIASARQARAAPGYLQEIQLKDQILGFSKYAALYWCDHYLYAKDEKATSPQHMPWLTEPDLLKEMLALRHHSKGNAGDDNRVFAEMIPSHLKETLDMTELDAFRMMVQMVDRQPSHLFVDLMYPPAPPANAAVYDWAHSNYPISNVTKIIIDNSYVLDRLFRHHKESTISNASDILVAIVSRNDHPLLLDFLGKLDGETLDEKVDLAEVSAQALYYAVSWGLVDVAKTLLSYQATPFHDLHIDINQPTLFHAAIKIGCKEMVQLLLDAGADVNALTPKGGFLNCEAAALHVACQFAHVDIVRLLLDAGANPKLAGEHGTTALHVASSRGFASICKLLVDHGATLTLNENKQSPLHTPARFSQRPRAKAAAAVLIESLKKQFPRFKEEGSQDAEDLAAVINAAAGHKCKTALIYAAVAGNLDLAKVLIDLGADVHACEDEGFNAMCRAAMMNGVDMVRLLADSGGEVDSTRSDGRHSLHDACAWGSQQVIEELLKRNAAPDHPDEEKIPPIAVAATWGLVRAIKQMIPVSSKDSISLALVYAARYGYHEIVTILLDAGADINYQDGFGNTPLQFACWNLYSRVAQLLLTRMPDINRPDNDNFTATADAARRGSFECLKLLLDAGADPEIETSSGKRPLIRAADVNDDCFRLLLERGAQTVLPIDIEKPNATPFEAGLSFLAGLAHKFPAGAVKVYLEYLKPRVSEEAFSSEINEALAVAAYASRLESMAALLEYGADPNAITAKFNAKHGSAIGLAVAYDNIDAVKTLLENKVTPVDLNKVDDYRDTPLHIALDWCITSIQRQMVELLLEHGADASISSGSFGTVLNATSQISDDDLLDLILSQSGVSKDAADQLGRLPIHIAAARRASTRRIEFLSTETSTFRSQDKQGRNVLHFAAVGGMPGVVGGILEDCPDLINVPDRDGWTPLHWAVRDNETKVSECLIEHGANKEAKTHDRWTPRHVAIYHGNTDQLELLPEEGDETDDEELPSEAAERVADATCDSCNCPVFGTGYRCGSCPKYWFCFKCYWHCEETHPKDHVFQRFDQETTLVVNTPPSSEFEVPE